MDRCRALLCAVVMGAYGSLLCHAQDRVPDASSIFPGRDTLLRPLPEAETSPRVQLRTKVLGQGRLDRPTPPAEALRRHAEEPEATTVFSRSLLPPLTTFIVVSADGTDTTVSEGYTFWGSSIRSAMNQGYLLTPGEMMRLRIIADSMNRAFDPTHRVPLAAGLPHDYAQMLGYTLRLLGDEEVMIDDEADTSDPFLDGLSRNIREMLDLDFGSPNGRWSRDERAKNDWGRVRFVTTEEYDSVRSIRTAHYLVLLEALVAKHPDRAAYYGGLSLDVIAACSTQYDVSSYLRSLSPELAMEMERRYKPLKRREERYIFYMCGNGLDAWERSRNYRELVSIARLAAAAGRLDVLVRAQDAMIDEYMIYVGGESVYWEILTLTPELEEAGVKTHDLLFGLALRDGVTNHVEHDSARFFGGLGRALAESGDTLEVERRLRAMIDDERLDEKNRTRFFTLYMHYLRHLPREEWASLRIAAVCHHPESFPAFLRDEIEEWEVRSSR